MNTKTWIRAELRARLHNDEPMPPFTAVETLICEAIDRLAGIPIKQHRLAPHEHTVFEEKLKS